MIENKTATFLGPEYSWNKVQLELHDVHEGGGGLHVLVPSFTAYQSFITCYDPGGKEQRFKLRLGWDEKKALCELCVAQDLVAMESGNGAGATEGAWPKITLTNARREKHTVAASGDMMPQNARFAAVYEALMGLVKRTEGLRPMARRLESGEKWLLIFLLIAAVALLGAVAFFPARALVAAWWSTRFGLLFGLHAALMVLLLAALVVVGRGERRKELWDRTFSNPFMLGVFNLLFFLGLVGSTGLVEEAIALWRGATVVEADAGQALYGTLAYSAVLTGWLTFGVTALVGRRVQDWLDERW